MVQKFKKVFRLFRATVIPLLSAEKDLQVRSSYLMSGPPDIDIRDISFKLRNITCVSQSFSRFYVGFGLQSCVWWGEPVGLTKMHV